MSPGHFPEAFAYHEEALALARTLRSRPVEGEVLNGFARTCLESGDLQSALAHYREAVAYADETSDAYQRGFTHTGLGDTLHALGRTDEAEKHWRTAFEALAPMGVPDADAVAERMRAAGPT